MLTLRDYQHDAIDGVFDWFEREEGNPLVVLPTGTGKSLVIAAFCGRVLDDHPDSKILIVTHVKELIAQNYAEMLGIWPDAPAGINSAGIGRRDYRHQIIFCGVQSVAKHAHKFGKVDLVLVDEAHLIPRNADTRYGRLFKTLKIANPFIKIVGLTATPYRLDSGRLDRGKDRMFDGIAYDYSILRAVEEGYLSRLVSKSTDTKFDLSDVGTRGGEFIPDQLQDAVDRADVNKAVVEEIVGWASTHGRKSWLVFASGVAHADHICDLIRIAGYAAECITGETPKADRDRMIAEFKSGSITCLCSVGVLTTGFNAPAVDLIAMARPTKSTGLYVQICGRGSRVAPGKENCLILDFAGNIDRHGPVDQVDPKEKEEGDGKMPIKKCPECSSVVHAAVRECPDCGYVFPPREIKIAATASTAIVMSNGEPEWVRVDSVSYRRHQKEGKPDSMMVTYHCGLARHREWVCFEHEGYAKTKAARWWWERTGDTVPPEDVSDALEICEDGNIDQPTEIQVRPDGQYTKIVATRGLQVWPGGTRTNVFSAQENIKHEG